MSKHIMVMAGGTGGHVYPALAVAQEMRVRGWHVTWLGTQKGLESRVTEANNIVLDLLAVEGIRGKGLLSKIRSVFKLFQACVQAFSVLRDRKPDVVLGMGGFVAGPGGLMAKLLGIPVVIHEQNRVPGTTNRLLVKLAASRVLEAFPDSFAQSVDAICTGNPLRADIVSQPPKLLWTPDAGRKLRVLVLGGSQGAKVLNDNVPEALAMMADTLEVMHQTGAVMRAEVADRYRSHALSADVFAFIEDMAAAYQWADIIICRAGAMTVSEVAASGLPAIFVPLLHAIDDHQTANAKYLTEAGAALLMPQSELNAENLCNLLKQAMIKIIPMSQAAKQKSRLDATQTVADICVAEAAL